MRTTGGYYLDLQYLLSTICRQSASATPARTNPSRFRAWLAILAFCGLLLLLINRKLRVCEVAG